MASGCLGLVSFPREPGRVSLERIALAPPGSAPGPLPTIRASASSSSARSTTGRVVLGAARRRTISTATASRARTRSPRSGPNAAAHVRRTDAFPHCADLMINSAF